MKVSGALFILFPSSNNLKCIEKGFFFGETTKLEQAERKQLNQIISAFNNIIEELITREIIHNNEWNEQFEFIDYNLQPNACSQTDLRGEFNKFKYC